MQIKITHRITLAVLFECEADSLKIALKLAVEKGTDLRGAYLQGADLRGAYLQGADLQGADLQGTYLQGTDLQGAYLQGQEPKILCLPVGDSRGYRPVAVWTKDHWQIQSGCRNFTIDEARAHWGHPNYRNKVLAAQYVAACDWLEAPTKPEVEAEPEATATEETPAAQ